MVNIIKQSGKEAIYLVEYVADTEADIDTLPTNALPGSTCIVIETSEVYMLNGQKEWKKI